MKRRIDTGFENDSLPFDSLNEQVQEQGLLRSVLFFSTFSAFSQRAYETFLLTHYKILALFDGFMGGPDNLFAVFMRKVAGSKTQTEHKKWIFGQCADGASTDLDNC